MQAWLRVHASSSCAPGRVPEANVAQKQRSADAEQRGIRARMATTWWICKSASAASTVLAHCLRQLSSGRPGQRRLAVRSSS